MNVVRLGKFAGGMCGLVAACVSLAGCPGTDAPVGAAGAAGSEQNAAGADSESAGAAETSATGGARATGGSGSLSYPGCEHVIVSSTDVYTSEGSTPIAVAAWKGQLYMLSGDGKFQTVRVTDGASIKELARVADDDNKIDFTPSTLLVGDEGFFFDGYQDGHNRLIGVPLAGGEGVVIADLARTSDALGSWFVGDQSSLYFAADGGGGPVLMSTPRTVAKASAPVVISDDTAFYEGLTGLGQVGASVFAVDGGFSAFVAREFPVVPADPPVHARSTAFLLKDCRSSVLAPHVVSGDDSLYVGCNSDGNEQSYIFHLPPAAEWPEGDDAVSLEPLASGPHLDEDSFAVVGKDVYFHDVDADDNDHVYRVPSAGGTPVRVLDTHVVHHMASDGKTLFVEGSCGIQTLAL